MTTTAQTRTRGDALAEDLNEANRAMVKMSDDELVTLAYRMAGAVADDTSNDWYQILGEIFERFAPEAETRNLRAMYRGEADTDIEVASSLEGFYQRQAARLAYAAEREQGEA